MFYVGQKVICINDDVEFGRELAKPNAVFSGSLDGLTKGNIYTISKIVIENRNNLYVKPLEFLELVEIDRVALQGRYPPGYKSSRFRPLEEKKDEETRTTNINVFLELLKPENIEKYKKEVEYV